MRVITITVPRDGISTGKASPKIEADGYTGESCKNATSAFEAALGTVTEDSPTSGMYEVNDGVEHVRENEGGV